MLSVPGHQYIADAGSNTIDEVDENGSVRIIAFVPNPLLNFGGHLVPISDSVPTCVAQRADGDDTKIVLVGGLDSVSIESDDVNVQSASAKPA